jgi:hypothetical protein
VPIQPAAERHFAGELARHPGEIGENDLSYVLRSMRVTADAT